MPQPAGAEPPVRGTQSFVGVMGQVWRRPSLMALEVMWRWVAGAPLLALLAWEILRVSRVVSVDWSALQSMTVFQPVAAFHTIGVALAAVMPAAKPVALWFLPLSLVVWIVAGTVGRAWVLRRLDARLHAPPSTLLALGALRTTVLALVWALWAWGVRWAGQAAILRPAQAGGEPSIVGFCALLIGGTLGLFVAWAAASWVVHLAPLEAMLGSLEPTSSAAAKRNTAEAKGNTAAASLCAALRAGQGASPLRARLIETNLVMGIVKIALLVLAMVFSACPLPFASVETQTLLAFWWCGVGLIYLAALDFFHVAHAAAYVALWRAYNFPRESERWVQY